MAIHRIQLPGAFAHPIVMLAPLIVLLTLLTTAPSFAVAPPPGAAPANNYVDLPLADLEKRIPALHGLEPADDPDDLSLRLVDIADAIGTVVPRLPNIIAREEVYRTQVRSGQEAPQQMIAISRNSGPGITIAPQEGRGQEYRYLILSHHTDAGISVEELRTDPNGHPVNELQSQKEPLGSGFAYQWLLFSSANQPEFHFRYLGRQTLNGRVTDVIAFAQIPDRVRFPAQFAWHGKQAGYYYQGILWADAATSQIVFLHTDLLAPLPQMQLRGLTTELQFGPVHMRDYEGEFWLPQKVHLTIAQDRYDIDETHQYSDYHLFHSQATIVPVH
jgi:hypothetical protein